MTAEYTFSLLKKLAYFGDFTVTGSPCYALADLPVGKWWLIDVDSMIEGNPLQLQEFGGKAMAPLSPWTTKELLKAFIPLATSHIQGRCLGL